MPRCEFCENYICYDDVSYYLESLGYINSCKLNRKEFNINHDVECSKYKERIIKCDYCKKKIPVTRAIKGHCSEECIKMSLIKYRKQRRKLLEDIENYRKELRKDTTLAEELELSYKLCTIEIAYLDLGRVIRELKNVVECDAV